MAWLSMSSVNATGWPRPQGHGFYKLDFTSIRSTKWFNADGEVVDINPQQGLLSNYSASFYGEYGLTRRLTVVAYVPFWVRNSIQTQQTTLSNSAFGDVDLGLTYNFYARNRWVVSGNVTFGLPTGDHNAAAELYTGDGEFNQQLRLEAGYGGNRWYATGYLGFNNRTNDCSDEVRWLAEAGFWLKPGRWLVAAKFAGVQSLQNGSKAPTSNGLFSNNVAYASPQVSLTWEHNDRWGLTGTAGFAVSGANVLAAPSLAVGVFGKL